jgi:hypothetical protein
MFSSSQSWLSKMVGACTSVLAAAIALYLAVHIVEAIAVPLLIIAGVIGVLPAVTRAASTPHDASSQPGTRRQPHPITPIQNITLCAASPARTTRLPDRVAGDGRSWPVRTRPGPGTSPGRPQRTATMARRCGSPGPRPGSGTPPKTSVLTHATPALTTRTPAGCPRPRPATARGINGPPVL